MCRGFTYDYGSKKRGIKNIVVPLDNIKEAIWVKDINIFGFNKLNEVTDFLIGVKPYDPIINLDNKHHIDSSYIINFQDVQGQDSNIEFVAISVAGGHNLLMSGSPGSEKSMIATSGRDRPSFQKEPTVGNISKYK